MSDKNYYKFNKIENLHVTKTINGIGIITHDDIGYEGIEIRTAEEANILRARVNKACDMFLGTHKKFNRK